MNQSQEKLQILVNILCLFVGDIYKRHFIIKRY